MLSKWFRVDLRLSIGNHGAIDYLVVQTHPSAQLHAAKCLESWFCSQCPNKSWIISIIQHSLFLPFETKAESLIYAIISRINGTIGIRYLALNWGNCLARHSSLSLLLYIQHTPADLRAKKSMKNKELDLIHQSEQSSTRYCPPSELRKRTN